MSEKLINFRSLLKPTRGLNRWWLGAGMLLTAQAWAEPEPDSVTHSGITLDTSSLTFTDTGDGLTFSTAGQSTISFADETLTLTLETTDGDDGLVIDSSANLVSLTAQVTTDFEILGASFVVDEETPLVFSYDADADEYVLYGTALLKVNNGSDSDELTVVVGTDADDPGLVIDDTGITAFTFGLIDDFEYDGVTVEIGSEDTAFSFVYDAADMVYETYGDVSISYDETGTTFMASLGDADAPGLVLSSNASSELILDSLNATITGSFEIDALSFEISDEDPLIIIYSADTDFYEIDGMVTVAIEENMIAATFGYDVEEEGGDTTSYPGMQIQDGDLIGVDFLITDSFSIAGITMETTEGGIGFSHTGIQDYYYAFGGIQIGFGDQDVEFDAGTYDSPGIILSADTTTNGLELEFLLISLSGNLNFYGVELVPDDVTFNYSKTDGTSDDIFEFYGAVTVGVDGVDVSAFLGTEDSPGFAFVDGELLNLDLGISDSITLSGLTVATTGDYLGFSYSEESETYEVFGGLSVTFDGQTLGIQAGTSDAPGMQLVGDSSSHLVLTYLDATFTAGFSLYGIDLSLGDDGVTFIYDSDNDLYEVYGDVDVTIEGDEIDAFLGDANTPGFTIVGGTVTSVDIGVSTEISLGGFKFSSPEDNPLTITYTSDHTTYTVYGEAELDTLWDVSVTLGDDTNPGIEIVDNKWIIDDLAIEVDHINLGFAQIQEVAVDYSRDADTDDILVGITFDVVIPELQGEIDTTVTTDNGEISSIYLEYIAEGTTEGIEVLDTGVNVADMGVYLQNLDQPADLQVTGNIGLEFGGQLSIGGTTASLSYMEGSVYIDKNKLSISDSVYFGAYEENEKWKALIFQGDGEMLLDWADNTYSLDSDLYLPTDYGIKITDELLITKAYIVLKADAEVRVPDGIPLIGGDDLGDIGFDLLIDMADSTQSFAAAWVNVNLIATTEQAGIKYTFHNGKTTFIGSGSIDDLDNEITDVEDSIEKEGITYVQKTYSFDFTGTNALIADMSWYLDDGSGTLQDISDMRVTMTGTIRDLINETTMTAQPLTMHVMDFTDGSYSTVGDEESGSFEIEFSNSMGGKVSSQGLIKQDIGLGGTIIDQLLPGEVVITYSYPQSLELGANVVINEPSVVNYYDYAAPTIAIWKIEDDDNVTTSVSAFNSSESCYDAWQAALAASGDDNLFLSNYSTYESEWCVTTSTTDSVLHAGQLLDFQLAATTVDAYASGATITLYADTDNENYDGTPLMDAITYNSGGDYTHLGITEKLFAPQWVVENLTEVQDGTVYFYAAINNGHQKIVYTSYSDAYTIESPVYGVVYDTDETNPLSGFRVFLDTNGDKQYTAGVDDSTTTDTNGNYVFDWVSEGEVTVGVIIPQGYESNDTSEDLVTTTYLSGNSVEVDFDVNLLDSISGYVFEDTNGDGILDDGESGIQGVTLYLDVDRNGSYSKAADIETITNSDGFWRFYDVEVDTTYDVYILAYPSQLSNTDQSFITVETTTETVPGGDESGLEVASLEAENLIALSPSTTKYTEFAGNNFGVYPSAVAEVSDRKYMRYILSYFPDDDGSLASANLDPDNDGLINKIEQLLDTDPGSANGSPIPVISVGESSGSESEDVMLIEFDQVAGNLYKVQASSDLQNWTTIDSFRAHTSESTILEIFTDLSAERTFIRIEILE